MELIMFLFFFFFKKDKIIGYYVSYQAFLSWDFAMFSFASC